MTPLLPPRLLPLLPFGSRHGVAIRKPQWLTFTLEFTCLAQVIRTLVHKPDHKSRVTQRHQYSCTGSKWAPDDTSDLRTPEVENSKLLSMHTLGSDLPLWLHLLFYQITPHAPVTTKYTVLSNSTGKAW